MSTLSQSNRVAGFSKLLCGGLLLCCQSATAFNGSITINSQIGAPVNRLLMGSNTQWVDNGDSLVNNNGATNNQVLNLIRPVGVSMLRYPGGTLSDSFHWQDAIGSIATRGSDMDLSNDLQPVIFGINEFLQLAQTLSAQPVITVNVPSGTPTEAATWVNYMKQQAVAGKPAVKYWEIGNEPYLNQSNRPDLWMTPSTFISKFNSFAPAMRAADSTIKVGMPMRTDTINGVPVSAYRNFNTTLLSGLKVPIDYVALHYYFPYANNGTYTDTQMYWASMAAADVMAADLNSTTTLVQNYLHMNVPLVITEYNDIFTLGKGGTDSYIATLEGGLLVGDMLRVFTQMPNVQFADFWSLLGNWYFGMIDQGFNPRPAYYVLQMYSKLLQGNYLPITVSTPTFNAPSVGLVPAAANKALLTAAAATDGSKIRLVVINKALSDVANLQVNVSGALSNCVQNVLANVSLLTGDSALAGGLGQGPVYFNSSTQVLTANSLNYTIPAHSMVLIEINENFTN